MMVDPLRSLRGWITHVLALVACSCTPNPVLVPSCDTLRTWNEGSPHIDHYVLCPDVDRPSVSRDEACDYPLVWVPTDRGDVTYNACVELGYATYTILELPEGCEVPSLPEDIENPHYIWHGVLQCTDEYDVKN